MKRILTIAAKFFVAVVAFAVLAAGFVYFEDPLFWKRYYLVVSGKGILPQSGWAGSEFVVDGQHEGLFELADAAEIEIPADVLQEVVEYADAHRSSSLLVWHKDRLILREHFGDYSASELIVGKSMAKMVAGIVVARAIAEGHIESLDQPAADFIDEWAGSDREAITIRHMLHMAAGFEPYYTLDMSPFSSFMRSYLSGHNEDVLIDGYALVNAPGTAYDYSQAVSDQLAIVIERATGMPYGQYLSESLIQPIGAQGGQVMLNRPEGLAHSGCCLLLPSESWLRVGILLLNQGEINGEQLFPEGWMEEYLEPSPRTPRWGFTFGWQSPIWSAELGKRQGLLQGLAYCIASPIWIRICICLTAAATK